jgi:hypothetical protein
MRGRRKLISACLSFVILSIATHNCGFLTGVYFFPIMNLQEFVGCVIPDSGENAGYIGLVPEFEVSPDQATGELAFPQTFNHATFGEWPAHYVVWVWRKSDNTSMGRWSDNFMKNVGARKVGVSPAPANMNNKVVKIKMGGLPAGADAHTIAKARVIR